MNYRISDLLDGLEEAGQPVTPRGGNAARVKAKTLARLREAEAPARSAGPVRRRFRPAAILAAALAAVLLLSGSVFAAWKLGAFSYQEEFGPAYEVLDSFAQTYPTEPEEDDVLVASGGYADWIKAKVGDYNLYLFELSAEDGTLRAQVYLSATDESIPFFRDSGLTLSFLGYETESTVLAQGWMDFVTLSAPLDGSLAPDEKIVFILSGPGSPSAMAEFPLNVVEQSIEEQMARFGPRYATTAQTKDYRFTLRSLTASDNILYAVLDMEARTEWGMAHIDAVPEFGVRNTTHDSSGNLMAPKLLSSEEGLRRYLIGFVGSSPVNEPGDSIKFFLLGLHEKGDVAEHPYNLFDVKLEAVVSGAILAEEPEGEPAYNVTWRSVNVNPMGMLIKGALDGTWYDNSYPAVTLVFRDGTRESVVFPDWQFSDERWDTHEALMVDFEGQSDGSISFSLTFAQPVDPADLAAVIVDGQTFSLDN